MNKVEEGWRAVLEQNEHLHGRLLTWESLLFQLDDNQCRTGERLVKMQQILRSFEDLLERELARSFLGEECGFYTDAANVLPNLRHLIWELHEVHVALRERLAKIRAGLGEATFLEQPELTRDAGLEFSRALRAHMQQDERLVSAVVAARYRAADSGGTGQENVQPA